MSIHKTRNSLAVAGISLFLVSLIFLTLPAAKAVGPINPSSVNINSEDSNNRIAPGESLPISIKLINFGSQKRIDVIIDYQIQDQNGKNVYSETETVAVETTASFVKKIQLPYNLESGTYNATAVLHYPDQEQPATSKFSFLVEKKFMGIFINDLLLYGVIFLIVILVAVLIAYLFGSLRRKLVVGNFDYSDKPRSEIIYYEMLSNIIYQMRLRIGDNALAIAGDIPNLKINPKNGFVILIGQDPAKIISLLISRYEKLLGEKISFSLAKN